MPLLVSQPQFAVVDGTQCGPIHVGIAQWGGPQDLFSFVVKLTFTFAVAPSDDPTVARLAAKQAPLRGDLPSELPGAAESELGYGSDFCFYRPNCDVLLHGHAHASQPSYGIDAELRVGEVHRPFQVVGSEARRSLPMVAAAIRDKNATDYASAPVGPIAALREDPNERLADVEFLRYQHATFDQQLGSLEPDAVIVLSGLSPRAPVRKVKLPGLAPQLFVDGGEWGDGLIRLCCDTLFIDTDHETIECVWRAVSPVKTSSMSDIVSMLISVERAKEPRHPDELERSLCRGTFHYAWEESDLPDGAPDLSESDLTFATLRARGPQPEPQITIERYAEISAELAEKRQSRDVVLDKHGLDAEMWSLEERGWMGRMADASMAGDASLSEQFSALFLAAQAAHADPAEAKVTIDEYAETVVAIENGPSQGRVLDARKISTTAWIRINKRWRRAAQDDPLVQKQLDQALARARVAYYGHVPEAEAAK